MNNGEGFRCSDCVCFQSQVTPNRCALEHTDVEAHADQAICGWFNLNSEKSERDAALASLAAAEAERDRLREALPVCHVCKARVGEQHQPFCSVEPGEHTLAHAQFMSESALAAAVARAEKAEAANEHDRCRVAETVAELTAVLRGYSWLCDSRGSYDCDNDGEYQKEFGRVHTALTKALEPLRLIAADWSNCPQTQLEIAEAKKSNAVLRVERDAAFARVREVEAEWDALRNLPAVGGSYVEGTLYDLAHRAQVHLGLEQAKPLPDNALIAVLCDTVRLVREWERHTDAALAAARAEAVRSAFEWLDGEDGVPSDDPFSGDPLRRYLAQVGKEPSHG